jgi:hypothetical protein
MHWKSCRAILNSKKKIAELKKDLPVLQEMVDDTWTKESRLSEMKTELAVIDRKMQLSIAPENKEQMAEERKGTIKINESKFRKDLLYV